MGKYESFMKNPTKDGIPKVGAGFPEEALKKAEKATIRMNENADGRGPAISEEEAAPSTGVASTQLASLDTLESVFGKGAKKNSSNGKAD